MQFQLKQTLVLTLSLFVLSTSFLLAQNKQQPVPRWEYQQINCDTNELNRLGDEGWELVSTSTYSGGCSGYLLKRLKPADAPKYIDPAKRPAPPLEPTTCKLTLAQSPSFRGIRLGMSVRALLGLFPGSEENAEIKKRLEDAGKSPGGYGIAEFWINADSYQNVKEAKTLFADINSYFFTIFDGRVVSFGVHFLYRQDVNWEAGLWQRKLSEALHLPVTEKWGNPENNFGGALQCEEFWVAASGGQNPSFTITERTKPSFYDILNQRRRAAVEKLREEFKINP